MLFPELEHPYTLRVLIDPEIRRYYRTLIPKYVQSRVPMYDPHISVVRHETPPNLGAWGRHEGESVAFEYDPTVHFGTVYAWLDCFSARLEEIRVELGLQPHRAFVELPPGRSLCFHTTLGNFKEER
ncbi:MAG TPA: hypothetical protein VF796_17210 [Humisphaera sp.]